MLISTVKRAFPVNSLWLPLDILSMPAGIVLLAENTMARVESHANTSRIPVDSSGEAWNFAECSFGFGGVASGSVFAQPSAEGGKAVGFRFGASIRAGSRRSGDLSTGRKLPVQSVRCLEGGVIGYDLSIQWWRQANADFLQGLALHCAETG